MRCMVMAERIWVKKHAVMFVSTSELSDGSIPRLCILWMGGMPWRMFISIGNAIETCAPTCFTLFQAVSDIPVMWTNRLSRSEEHTSELQSQSNLVCRLLLEK